MPSVTKWSRRPSRWCGFAAASIVLLTMTVALAVVANRERFDHDVMGNTLGAEWDDENAETS